MQSRDFIEQLMLKLGGVALIPSTEAEAASVWVGEDDAPNGVAGYYERKRIAAPHHLAADSTQAQLTFTLEGVKYDLRCRHGATEGENLEAVVDVLRTLLHWESQGIVSFTEGLQPFTAPGTEWWRILRVAPDATEPEIRSAFHRLAREHHPDRGGDETQFKQLQSAYDHALDQTHTGGVVV